MELWIILGAMAVGIGTWAIINDKKRQEDEMMEFFISDALKTLDEIEFKSKAKKKAAAKKKTAKKAPAKKKAAKKSAKKKPTKKKATLTKKVAKKRG
jgi:MinD superfamily P-loop ATPase